MTRGRRAVLAFVLAFPAALGLTSLFLGFSMAGAVFSERAAGSRSGLVVGAVVALAVGAALLGLAFHGLRRVNSGR